MARARRRKVPPEPGEVVVDEGLRQQYEESRKFAPMEETMLIRVARNYDELIAEPLDFDKLARLNGGKMR